FLGSCAPFLIFSNQEVFNIFFIKSFIISYPSAYLHSCFIVPKNFLIKKKKWAEQEILYLISR
ncbi:hypothetical protein ABHA29_07825, partial [Enterococcus faecium]